ncbi:MAG: hypothetical protein ACE366_13140 [Bradymonadia bacterium]
MDGEGLIWVIVVVVNILFSIIGRLLKGRAKARAPKVDHAAIVAQARARMQACMDAGAQAHALAAEAKPWIDPLGHPWSMLADRLGDAMAALEESESEMVELWASMQTMAPEQAARLWIHSDVVERAEQRVLQIQADVHAIHSAGSHRVGVHETCETLESALQGMLDPLHHFAMTYGITLSLMPPVIIPRHREEAEIDREHWRTLLGAHQPIISLDTLTLSEPASVLYAVSQLAEELVALCPGWRAAFESVANEGANAPLYAPWLPTLVADVLTTVWLGPGALRGWASALGRPDAPEMVVTLDGAQPPAHLRITLMAHVLHRMGFARVVRPIMTQWRGAHRRPRFFVDPTTEEEWQVDTVIHQYAGAVDAIYGAGLPPLAGHGLNAIPGWSMSVPRWKRVEGVKKALTEGRPARRAGGASVVIAAGLEVAYGTGLTNEIAMRRVMRLLEKGGQGGSASARRGKGRAQGGASLVREAILLRACLASR